jgi:hypothetical protein
MLVYNIGVGCAGPTALVQAMSVNRHVLGSASGLYGFTQMAVGAALTALAGLGRDPALAAGVVLVPGRDCCTGLVLDRRSPSGAVARLLIGRKVANGGQKLRLSSMRLHSIADARDQGSHEYSKGQAQNDFAGCEQRRRKQTKHCRLRAFLQDIDET